MCVIYVLSIIRTHLILCLLSVLTYYCSCVMAVTDYVNTVRVVCGGPHHPLACLLHYLMDSALNWSHYGVYASQGISGRHVT